MDIGIRQPNRAVPMPDEIASSDTDSGAMAVTEMGLQALAGKPGPAYDSLVYGAALALVHLKRQESLEAAAETVRTVLSTGATLARFRAR